MSTFLASLKPRELHLLNCGLEWLLGNPHDFERLTKREQERAKELCERMEVGQ